MRLSKKSFEIQHFSQKIFIIGYDRIYLIKCPKIVKTYFVHF